MNNMNEMGKIMNKLYFYDGELDFDKLCINNILNNNMINFLILDGKFGHNANVKSFREFQKSFWDTNNCIILTNMTFFLDNIFWNEEEDKPEIYILKSEKWYNITDLTDKKIRKVHNIEKLYLSGLFDNILKIYSFMDYKTNKTIQLQKPIVINYSFHDNLFITDDDNNVFEINQFGKTIDRLRKNVEEELSIIYNNYYLEKDCNLDKGALEYKELFRTYLVE